MPGKANAGRRIDRDFAESMLAGRTRTADWVRILCVLALVMVGFAHKPVAAHAAPSTSEIAAYALPDGSLPTLCLGSDDSDGKNGMASRGCDACRLTSTSLPPMPADVTGEILRRPADMVVHARTEAIFRSLYPPSTGPRAPPRILSIV